MKTLLLDWGPREKGRAEEQAPLSSRKMNFYFSAIMATPRLFNIDANKWNMDRRPEPINP
jgi:hypothetical protein